MATTPLSEIHNNSKHWTITVYVSRLWHHRGGTDNGPIKHTDLVVLDAQGNHMYVEIAKDLVDQFMDVIEEGKVYELNRFLVHPKKINFRPVEGRFMIKFGRYTSVQERNVEGQVEYPFCTFALTPIANLPRPTDLPDRFTDVAGIITGVSKAVQFHSAYRTDPSTKRIIYLSDLTGNQISIVLWGDRATTFDGDWVISTAEKSPVIAIFVGTLIKGYDGRRSLSGSAPCRWYINEDLPEINEIHRRLQEKIPVVENILLPNQSADEINAQLNLETKTVAELLDLNIYDNENIKFFCTVTLTRLSPSQRWWFSSCNTCHKSSVPYGSAYRCSDPDCSCTDASPRYRLCYMGSDGGNEEVELIFFDRMGKEIIGKPLVTILRSGQSHNAPLEDVIQAARGDMSIPRDLAAVIATKYRFVVSVSRKSFDAECKQSSFQVHRIDADLGKQSGSSALRRGRNLPMASPRKSVSDVAALPNRPLLDGSSSANMSADVTHLSDPVRALPSLPTPPSVNKTLSLRTRSIPPDSKVPKPLFQDSEDKGLAVQMGDKVLEDTGDLSETDQSVKEDAVVDSESVVVTPLPNEKKRKTQGVKGATGTSLKKNKP